MCTVLLPPGDNPIAVNKNIVSYHIISIPLSVLTPYAQEIIGDRQCGFRCNSLTTDHIFCIRKKLEKEWQYTEAVHQLYKDFKKSYDAVRTCIIFSKCFVSP